MCLPSCQLTLGDDANILCIVIYYHIYLYQQKNDQGKFLHKHSNAINQSLAFTSIGANFMRWDGKKYVNEKEQDGSKRGFNPVPTIHYMSAKNKIQPYDVLQSDNETVRSAWCRILYVYALLL